MRESRRDTQHLSATRGRLLGGLLARQEEERWRIAHELREGTLQQLAALALTLDALQHELNTAKRSARDRLSGGRALALTMIRDLRRLAGDLRPSLLDDLGLAPALQSYAGSRLSSRGVQVRFAAKGLERRPSQPLENSLYRVGQEAIDNIATHAEARTASIALDCDERILTLVVEDDGKGFAPADVLEDPDATPGLGIVSMQERIASIGGSFSMRSAPGQGTRILAKIPLDREDEGNR